MPVQIPLQCLPAKGRLSDFQRSSASVACDALHLKPTLWLPALPPSQFTNVTSLHITVRGWHDIGLGAQQLLLHLSTALPKVQEVSIFDRSHEDLYEPLHDPKSGA